MTATEQARPAVAAARLALGTAQFGAAYGIANRTGAVPRAEVAALLAEAAAAGVRTIDTASLYGESEERLGEAGVGAWEVVSKLAPLPADCRDVGGWVRAEAEASLRRLRVPALAGFLLHRPGELLGPRGPEIYGAMQTLKREGLVRKVGISAYDPEEVAAISAGHALDLVQAPLNLLDRRLVESGCLGHLAAAGTEVHVRSVFLQGLLLMPERPAHFQRWAPLWRHWDEWRRATGVSALAACLAYVLAQPAVARVVVGVDGLAHLRGLLAAAEARASWPETWRADDPELLNPGRWPKP